MGMRREQWQRGRWTVDGRTTSYAYNGDGSLRATWGADYPQRYVYQSGRLAQLHAYRGHAGGEPTGNGDITTWAYKYGLLQRKTDAAGKSVLYTYTPEGRLQTREWARGVVTTYGYDTAGQIRTVTYSDGTSSVLYSHDEKGRMTLAQTNETSVGREWTSPTQVSESRDLGVDYWVNVNQTIRPDGQPNVTTAELFTQAGLYADVAITPFYDSATGFLSHSKLTENTTVTRHSGASFARTPGTSFIRQINHFATNGTSNPPLPSGLEIVKTETRDGLGRTKKVTTGLASGALRKYHEYEYTNGLRTKAITERGDWTYSYNDRAEVTGGTKKFGNTVVPGYQFGYDFDTIGNRISHTVNGNVTSYTRNSLNQYGGRSNPGVIDVRAELELPGGYSATSAEVQLNGGTASSAQPFVNGSFAKSVPVDNTSARFDTLQISATATNSSQQPFPASETRKALVPPAVESFNYDYDGNLIGDALQTYTYDGENRLIAIERKNSAWPANTIPAGMVWGKLAFQYDYIGRRVSKQVYATNKTTLLRQNRFVYDGWNLVLELEEHLSGSNAGVTVTRSYHWGPDLSGTTTGAGGVGGLLAVHVQQTPLPVGQTETFKRLIPSYDGNGNILAYLDGNTGALVQEEEYGPFGETLRPRIDTLLQSPFGWSSKIADQETALIYYGLRYYQSSQGRWIGRDPINEAGGLNLFGFINNAPVNGVDYLGMEEVRTIVVANGPHVGVNPRDGRPDWVQDWSNNSLRLGGNKPQMDWAKGQMNGFLPTGLIRIFDRPVGSAETSVPQYINTVEAEEKAKGRPCCAKVVMKYRYTKTADLARAHLKDNPADAYVLIGHSGPAYGEKGAPNEVGLFFALGIPPGPKGGAVAMGGEVGAVYPMQMLLSGVPIKQVHVGTCYDAGLPKSIKEKGVMTMTVDTLGPNHAQPNNMESYRPKFLELIRKLCHCGTEK